MHRLLRLAALLAAGLLAQACQTPPPPAPAPRAYSGPTLSIAQSERGVQIFLPSSVLFGSGSAQLNNEQAQAYMVRVAALLNDKTRKPVALEGHTDNTGSDAINETLSKARATEVMSALARQGVQGDRMSALGHASRRPIASNANDEGKRLNRRVEIVILDERVENITAGEPAGAFEAAFDKIKTMVDQGLIQAPPAAQSAKAAS